EQNPNIDTTVIYENMPSASKARNIGISVAKFSSVTFIDADDFISKDYIESMLDRITSNSIACSHIINIDDDNVEDEYNYANKQLLEIKNTSHFFPKDVIALSTMTCCKAVPTY